MTSLETVMLSGRNGTNIAASTAGDGPPLLLVHGTSIDRTRWAPLLPYLTDSFTIYGIDRRGRGDSADEADYAIDHEFADMAALVDQLAERHGGPVNVFGHSYGAFCLLHGSLATTNIGRAVLYEPPVPTGTPVVAPDVMATLNRAAKAEDRDTILETFAMQVVRYPQAEFEMLQTLPTWQNRRQAALTIPRELAALDARAPFDPAEFAGYQLPTRLLLGSDSPDFLQRATHTLHDHLTTTNLEVMAGQQHNAIDTVPAHVGRLITEFLNS